MAESEPESDDRTDAQIELWERYENGEEGTIVPYAEAFPEANPKVHQGIFWDTERQEEVVPDQIPAEVN